MKNVKKLLSSQAKDILPDEKIKENIAAEIYGVDGQLSYAGGGTEVKRHNKGIFAAIAAALALIIILGVTLPLIFNGSGISPTLSGTITTDEFYAYGAASAGSIISAMETQSVAATSNTKTAAKVKTAGSSDEEQRQAAELVNEYIYYIEELLGNGSSIAYSTEAFSGSEDYGYSMTITYRDLLGGSVNYVMYYNETPTDTKTDKDEVETNYEISGILLVNGGQYAVTGGRNEESETGEISNEIWFKAYLDSDSYIVIRQEYEAENEDGELETEQKTEIYVYSGGKLIESVVAETESENGETELELEITKDGTISSIECNYNTSGGQTIINVEAKIGNAKYTFKIYVENDCYRYVFGNTEYTYDRN